MPDSKTMEGDVESPKNEGERLPVEGTSDLSDGLGARRKGEVTSAEETLIAKIEKILSGIDKTEIEDQEKGWWETSTGAVFGAEKLAEIKTAIRDHFESGLTAELTGAGVHSAAIWNQTETPASGLSVRLGDDENIEQD